MRARPACVAVALAATLGGCSDGNGPPPPQAANLRALHTILGGPSLTVLIDGGRGQTLAFGEVSKAFPLSPGQHDLTMQPVDMTASLIVLFNTVEGGGAGYDVFAVDTMVSGSVAILPLFVSDSGGAPAAGHTRLRVANFAAGAPAIDAYRTQPDSTGLIPTQLPLAFKGVTPYFESTPGKWTVVISHAGVRDTLLVTDSIALADGQGRTVALVDSSGSRVSWRVIVDH
jgi:Domain of unknown function (DUF4397)